ncbi:MAG: 3-phosphoserine/phosphohydroxythreonine transaminase [Saprospirales bacterium]|nr:3-phosphoserine/phosphohydroxythreonine transaminase [Saprospirales bacterium]
MKKHNFNAGPAILPAEVLEKAARACVELDGIGLSLLEISHRSSEFTAIMDRSVHLVRELLQLDEAYHVLFLSGGASSQFYMSALNLLAPDQKASYVDTGTWSYKAIQDARRLGTIEILASSKEEGYTFIPKNYSIPEDARYLHLTSNNTIYGTQYHAFPNSPIPLVCDMSSDIMSRPFDIRPFGLIYAGAQKNIGPAGATLVIVRKDMLGATGRDLSPMMDYSVHAKENSLYNTPPVFPIYVTMLTLEWILGLGGLEAMERRNREKQETLYREIDSNPLFKGRCVPEDRSWMNVTYDLTQPDLEAAFLKACKEAGIEGVKGHRSAGGFRASLYNALPVESVKVLTGVMRDFAEKNG